MTKIYPPHITAQIFDAMASAEMGNNGYADMRTLRDDVVSALELAGFHVRFGQTSDRVYTPAGWAAIVAEQNARMRAIVDRRPSFDYEGAILARQERHAARQDAA